MRWQRPITSHCTRGYQLRLPCRPLSTFRQTTADTAKDNRPGLVRRGVTAFFAISGVMLWGTTLLEYIVLESTLPGELEELLKAEEKEEEKVAKFYGLEAMSKDASIPDDLCLL